MSKHTVVRVPIAVTAQPFGHTPLVESLGILASLAEFERALIAERTKAGVAAARARGRKGGTPF